ncbi:hypothetical protein HPP92_017234 [Vanilla planifolia]|uniref:Uncharacterized protein n=1 Tax=Vanilla planifolia TaxID=51239 RepID=A0A835QJ29_VANPL|nr:hypothetical protein HPP92_017234 [Vanilla planifolia]
MEIGEMDQKASSAAVSGGVGGKQQLVKSRTMSGDGQSAKSSSSMAAFQGPLFPAIRRASSGPLPPPIAGPARQLAVVVDDTSDASVFHGPLLPAVRRAASGPLPPPLSAPPTRRLAVAVDDPSDTPAFQGPLFPAVRRGQRTASASGVGSSSPTYGCGGRPFRRAFKQ